MSYHDPHINIKWSLGEDFTADGVIGIDSEKVYVDDLVKWAKKRQKALRKGIKDADRRIRAAERLKKEDLDE